MPCNECACWVTKRSTIYADGTEIVTFQAPDGKGHCQALEIDTKPDFACAAFVAGEAADTVKNKSGAPWQHSHAGPCPDCSGAGNAGDGGCYRCAGTGKVRHYDDGYIGDERTRMHPKERETAAPVKPKCGACAKEVEPDWKACPYCGGKLDAPADTEIVGDSLSVI